MGSILSTSFWDLIVIIFSTTWALHASVSPESQGFGPWADPGPFKKVFYWEQRGWPLMLCVSSSILCVPVFLFKCVCVCVYASVCVFSCVCAPMPVVLVCVCVCLCPGVRALLTPYPTPTRVPPPPPPPPSSSHGPPINFLQFICFFFQFLEQETNTKGESSGKKSSFCQNVTLLLTQLLVLIQFWKNCNLDSKNIWLNL